MYLLTDFALFWIENKTSIFRRSKLICPIENKEIYFNRKHNKRTNQFREKEKISFILHIKQKNISYRREFRWTGNHPLSKRYVRDKRKKYNIFSLIIHLETDAENLRFSNFHRLLNTLNNSILMSMVYVGKYYEKFRGKHYLYFPSNSLDLLGFDKLSWLKGSHTEFWGTIKFDNVLVIYHLWRFI